MKKNIKLKNSLIYNNNNIFTKYINNKYKLIPLNNINNYIGETKYYPSDSKEWSNNIYYFNNNYVKNLPLNDLYINKLIKGYFDLNLTSENLKLKFKALKRKRFSLNKIFISKAELKHTNSKVIITFYVFNRERIVLKKKLKSLKRSLLKIRKIFLFSKSIYINLHTKLLNNILYKELIYIKRIKLKFDINNLKFKDILLYKLSKLLSKLYNKKVEFNIINLKSFTYNTDITTEIMKKKLIHRDANLLKILNFILKKSNISKDSKITSRLRKKVNLDLLENKYNNLNINTIIKNVDLNETIKNLYILQDNNNEDIIFNSIKYKNIGGIRLEVKGRLTKRSKAERSTFKMKIKGTLRNTDSSYKGLTSINYRGNTPSNLEYSLNTSKRRVGAFAIKGWISGK